MAKQEKTVHVYVEGGVVQDVLNLPKSWDWQLHDADNEFLCCCGCGCDNKVDKEETDCSQCIIKCDKQ